MRFKAHLLLLPFALLAVPACSPAALPELEPDQYETVAVVTNNGGSEAEVYVSYRGGGVGPMLESVPPGQTREIRLPKNAVGVQTKLASGAGSHGKVLVRYAKSP